MMRCYLAVRVSSNGGEEMDELLGVLSAGLGRMRRSPVAHAAAQP